ncbi:transglycosylase family protein [Macrococcus caseolyticus]|nr:transglycosylase family protein [Macrococcus caseolyticus]
MAYRHGTTVAALKYANGLRSNLIHPNQILTINSKQKHVTYKKTTYKPTSYKTNTYRQSTYKAPINKTVYTKQKTIKATRTYYINRGLNWAALAQCESGGNPRINTGNGYYGMYQFDLRTWRGVGGYGYPHQATAAEQTYRAQLLYNMRGAQPWPYCGKRL